MKAKEKGIGKTHGRGLMCESFLIPQTWEGRQSQRAGSFLQQCKRGWLLVLGDPLIPISSSNSQTWMSIESPREFVRREGPWVPLPWFLCWSTMEPGDLYFKTHSFPTSSRAGDPRTALQELPSPGKMLS